MTQYAYFDSTFPGPSPVLGFYDTEAQPQINLVALTATQWANRTNGYWAILHGQLVPYSPPPGDPWQVALAAEIAAGLNLISTGTPSLDANYALDQASQTQVYQIGVFCAQFATFPDGSVTFMYPDSSGSPHAFAVVDFVDFFKAYAAFVAAVNTQAQIMKNGGTPSWPSNTVTIS